MDGAKDELMIALDEEADDASSPPSVSPPFPPRLPTTNDAEKQLHASYKRIVSNQTLQIVNHRTYLWMWLLLE